MPQQTTRSYINQNVSVAFQYFAVHRTRIIIIIIIKYIYIAQDWEKLQMRYGPNL